IPGPEAEVIKQAPGLLREGNRAIASSELYVLVDLDKRSTQTAANVPLRGIEPAALQVRDEVKLVQGRLFQFGTNEAIIGQAAVRQFSGADLGSEIKSGELRLSIGAVFGAILTMYTAVASRTREIATLRALGFNTGSVLVSVLTESMALAVLGGVIGGVVAYLGFNGYQTATMNFQTFSQVAFAFAVTPALLIQGLSYAMAMGLIGGLLPAIRAARLPISSALRRLYTLTLRT